MTASRTPASIAAPTGLDALRVVSWSHRHAGFEELARVAMPAAAQRALIERLRESGLEAALLCTCNRTELYWYALGPADDAAARAALAEVVEGGVDPQAGVVELAGAQAARHLFRLAAGLESMLVGESEVLGQMRDALESAEEAGIASSILPVFFHAALRFGRRVRAETRIGQGALSVASAAVRHLAQDYPDLGSCTAVVIGAGVTGLKVARHLKAERVGRVAVLNRTRERAESGAAAIGAVAGSLSDLPHWLGEADAVVAAVHVEAPVVTPEVLRAALAVRPAARRPLALVDLSLPRAIHPDCAGVPGVVLHDLSGLERIVADNRALREREIPNVEAMLERELEIFAAQARSSAARPLVAELRRRAEAIRRQELRRLQANGVTGLEAIDHVTRRIVDRLLQGPSEALRRGDLSLDPRGATYLRALLGLAGPETAEARDESL